jgi:cap2 methyltransferase
VTADGSINCADEPDKQEIVIGQLLYCEVVAALVSLADGGSLVVKMFTMYEHHTVAILFLLCCLFEEVEIIKPGTSKPENKFPTAPDKVSGTN